MCVCVCFCVFLHDNSKRNQSRNMKFKYFVVNENNSDKFDWALSDQDQGHGMTLKFFAIYCNANFRSHNSTLAQARKLILSMSVYLIIIYNFFKYRHA